MWNWIRGPRLAAVIAFAGAALVVAVAPASAQPNGTEMCGDGTTFRVDLPGRSLGIDDSRGVFRSVDVPEEGPDDHVLLPNGCRIYAILVSGYNQNAGLTDLPFYEVAELVARNNGYVHVSWWNNFNRQYMAGPLHSRSITVRRLGGLLDDVVIPTSPGDEQFQGFAPANLDFPKANPDEDFQFQSDAARVIRAINDTNPNAIVIVVGHSMGGGAVVRLAQSSDLRIDLLAPIDPVNNRDTPRGRTNTEGWSRWRVNHDFLGYKQWDCSRNSLGVCRDFDPRPFFSEYRCQVVGSYLDDPPATASRAPLVCPYTEPYRHPGTTIRIRSNVKRLYHRWQTENTFPFDYENTERLSFWTALTSSKLGPNYQQAISEGTFNTRTDQTCKTGTDPNNSNFTCFPTDGHGEIVGHRGPVGALRPALELTNNWPSGAGPRRTALLALATSTTDAPWAYRPSYPDLCMVCGDIADIVQDILDHQPVAAPVDTTAPVVGAAASPQPNSHGWHNEDVVVDVTASDEEGGSGVSGIETTLTGAQTGVQSIDGDSAQLTIIAEGQTTISYVAHDDAGNDATPELLEVRLDKTHPAISAATSSPANASGWHNTDVVVVFTASDDRSGLVSTSDAVVISSEGAMQEVIGAATDLADNSATATAIVNIDKTPPVVTAHLSVPASADGWHRSDVVVTFTATDSLSGVQFVTAPVTVTGDGANQVVTGSAIDAAGNVSSTSVVIKIDTTPPEALVTFSPELRRMVVKGRDEGSGTTGQPIAPSSVVPLGSHRAKADRATRETYRIEDRAGNVLTMVIESQHSTTWTQATIVALDYGDGAQGLPYNDTWFAWAGALTQLEQSVAADDQLRVVKKDKAVKHAVYAVYVERKTRTTIAITSPPPRASSVRPGLVVIGLATNRGKLEPEIAP
jgi:pimeloyl-ACP methyl ester carboxylesterase